MASTNQDHAHIHKVARASEIRTALMRLLQLMAGEVARRLDRPGDVPATPAASGEIERQNHHKPWAGRFGAPPVSLFLLAIRMCRLINVAAACHHRRRSRF